jgi:hypothetical protein
VRCRKEVLPGDEAYPEEKGRVPVGNRPVLVHGIDNSIAGHMDLCVTDSFLKQVLARELSRGKEVIRDVVGNDAVDLLGHAAVETPQSRLDMPDRDMEFGCRERCCEDGIGVSLDKDYAGPVLQVNLFDPRHDLRRLLCMAAGPDMIP